MTPRELIEMLERWEQDRPIELVVMKISASAIWPSVLLMQGCNAINLSDKRLMDLTDEMLTEVRKIVEYGTGRPAHLADDEEWALAIDIVMQSEKSKLIFVDPSVPICPHCGSQAPYGDERHIWISAHLESRFHRWWNNFKRG